MRQHFILLALLLVHPLLAQQQPQQTVPNRPAETYQVSGRVVNALTGAPLPHSVVYLQDAKSRISNRSVGAGDDGRFVFADVQLGKYNLSAEKRGFPAQSYQQHEEYSTAIAVGPNLVSENLTLSLTPSGEIFGFVTDDANEPVRDAHAELFKNESINGTRTTHAAGTVTTDDRGRYEFANLTQGSYFLAMTAKPWYAQAPASLAAVPAGKGAPSAQVHNAFDVDYPLYFYPNVTDVDAADPIPIKGGERVQIDFNLVPQRALHIRIRVPDLDPQAGISASLSQSIFGAQVQGPQQTNFQVIEPGIAEISGFPPGRYDLSLIQNDGKGLRQTHLSLDARDNGLQELDQVAQGDVSVTGKVVFPNGGKREQPAAMMLHEYQPPHDYFAQLDDKDEFSFSVPPGTYEIRGGITNHYIAQVSSQNTQMNGRRLRVEENHPVALTVVTGTAYGQIDGFVRRSNDGGNQGVAQGISAAMVVLVPADPANNEILFRRDQSDSDGSFTLGGIVPGDYRLLAIEKAWDLEWRRPELLAMFLAKSFPVHVRPGDHLNLNVSPQTAK